MIHKHKLHMLHSMIHTVSNIQKCYTIIIFTQNLYGWWHTKQLLDFTINNQNLVCIHTCLDYIRCFLILQMIIGLCTYRLSFFFRRIVSSWLPPLRKISWVPELCDVMRISECHHIFDKFNYDLFTRSNTRIFTDFVSKISRLM